VQVHNSESAKRGQERCLHSLFNTSLFERSTHGHICQSIGVLAIVRGR